MKFYRKATQFKGFDQTLHGNSFRRYRRYRRYRKRSFFVHSCPITIGSMWVILPALNQRFGKGEKNMV